MYSKKYRNLRPIRQWINDIEDKRFKLILFFRMSESQLQYTVNSRKEAKEYINENVNGIKIK